MSQSNSFATGEGPLDDYSVSCMNSSKDDDCIHERIENMCSVLNVVIDHTMEKITPMEAKEWTQIHGERGHRDSNLKKENEKTNGNHVLVPVVRIFGPLLRDPYGQPMQSACLYIHGAYPYILARPVVAGPDGSICAIPSKSIQIDWDDLEEVASIQSEIKATLEDTLQSSFVDRELESLENRQEKTGSETKKPNGPIIRRVTVVKGRGFYTFCPGPSTCFLRIEYYDPKLRWKVKLAMERGLQLPRRYHPDLRRYDRSLTDEDPIFDSLRFNCYEAHIPYTMQFFKDYNLAGMSYIHVRNGKIRGTLPKRFFPRNKEVHRGIEQGGEMTGVFLQSNTPERFLWPVAASSASLATDGIPCQSQNANQKVSTDSPTTKDQNQDGNSRGFPSLCYLFSNYTPPGKNSSCDIEIDCTVDDIQNVDDIMTSLPSDQDERDKIQWRAVPSLQEIWREERARMKKLLSPEVTQDIIGEVMGSDTPTKTSSKTFTLDVKKNAPRSGTKLAVKGMWSLVNVSNGLCDEFLRALVDILERHKKNVRRVDRELRQMFSKEKIPQGSATIKSDLGTYLGQLTTFDYPAEQTGASAQLVLEKQMHHSKSLVLDSHDEIDQNNGLLQQSSTSSRFSSKKDLSFSPNKKDETQLLKPCNRMDPQDTQTETPSCIKPSQEAGGLSFESNDREDDIATDLHDCTQRLLEPLSYSCTQDMHDRTLVTTLDPADFSQRVERGDSIMHTQDHDVEDLIDPDTLAPYDRIYFGEHCCRAIFQIETDMPKIRRVCGFQATLCPRQDHEYMEKRAEPGMYDTIATGTVVDGVIDLSKVRNSDAENDDEDCDLLEDYCRRSQKFVESQAEQKTQSALMPIASRFATMLMTQAIEEGPTVNGVHCDEPIDRISTDEKSIEYTPLINKKRSLVEYLSQDGEGSESSANLPLGQDREDLPQWLRSPDQKAYTLNEESIEFDESTPTFCEEFTLVEPISNAPTRGEVKELVNRRKKREKLTHCKESTKEKKINQIQEIRGSRDKNDYGDQHCSTSERLSSLTNTKGLSDVSQFDTPGGRSKGNISTKSRISNTSISQESENALDGICNQGGRIFIQGGGGLKAKTRSLGRSILADSAIENEAIESKAEHSFLASPITMMAVEIHVQCRTGASRLDSKKISMAQDSSKDKITAIAYVYARDRGGGESLEMLSKGCICSSLDGENPQQDPTINRKIQMELFRSMPRNSMGVRSPLSIDVVKDERHLLRRFKDVVRVKDPDLMMSWDTQGAGLGYIIERGHTLGRTSSESGFAGESKRGESNFLDMAKLLGRTPLDKKAANFTLGSAPSKPNHSNVDQSNEIFEVPEQTWRGSGLGGDWDDRVGAGVAAASIVGRLVFSGWKIVAEEVKHPNASYLPAVVFAVLNKRIPHHDEFILTKWYANNSDRWRTLNHRLTQATASLLLFDALDIIGRAGEAARLSGVEFLQSFPGIRGSQYKVEGVLLRALKSLRSDERGSKRGKKIDQNLFSQQTSASTRSGKSKSQSQSPWKIRRANKDTNELHEIDQRQYFFFSPSQEDTKEQEALEVQALTLEPQSGHFTDPIVVCDFTALYPSLIIAYNLCYSTCAGKLEYHSTRREMQLEGKTKGKVGPFAYNERRTATVLDHHLKSLFNVSRGEICYEKANFSRDRAYVAPTGTVYVSENVLKGVLPQVLDEMLTTRAMLKKAAKEYKKNVKNLSPAILRQLEARQLALKYVANVTYGYTSATFSGRCAMPLLADTIVECGRRTLQRAMNMANQWGRGIDPWGRRDNDWIGAEVIYGDTDSLFIRMPGRTYKEAFDFGEMFCNAVTSLNPPPVQLKLEKVYVGSIMQTMKRYCGMKYDSKDQKKPMFEAKGLETIRRDQCALTQKVLKGALIALFKDGINAVREYLFRQWSLIFAGDLPVSDFILTGRVRSKYRGGKEGPVQAVLARRLAEADPGRVVRHKERLSYVIVATPGVTFRLKDCVLTPLELLERWDAYKIHSAYYIERHVNAALQRCLGLKPHYITIADWYAACPKPRRRTHFWPIKSKRAMITAYFGNDVCSLCHQKCQADGSSSVVVCRSCRKDRMNSVRAASAALNQIENDANVIAKKCSKCNGCFESAETFAVAIKSEEEHASKGGFRLFQQQKSNHTLLMPLANCVCIDCPITYQRHRLRERIIETKGTYDALIRDSSMEW